MQYGAHSESPKTTELEGKERDDTRCDVSGCQVTIQYSLYIYTVLQK